MNSELGTSPSYLDGRQLTPRSAPPPVGTGALQTPAHLVASNSPTLIIESAHNRKSTPVVYAALNRLPPPIQLNGVSRARQGNMPIRVGFVISTFTFGGSETDVIELVYGADRQLLQFTGIAVAIPLPIPDGEPRKDGSFPPIYTFANPYIDQSDPRVRLVSDFREAVRVVVESSDIIMSWGLPNLQELLPGGRLPKVIVVSKDSGDWARSFLHPNSLLTRYCVGNSQLAAAAFPELLRGQVKIIPNGINPQRVVQRIPRNEQRRIWGLTEDDKVVGYLGRIERDKGVSKTAEGVACLSAEWKAVFIGVSANGRYTRELAQHCEQALPGRYRLLEWCHDVGSALAAFDVFCHPSDHEGFSNSLGEAWLAGVPTVYTQGTGAVPDLGELGIGVSLNADGAEIASAVRRAYSNQELIRRAQGVIENGFLAKHSVQYWTNYLLEVHRQAEKPRVMLLCPTEVGDKASTLLSLFAVYGQDLDLCCVVREGNYNGLDTESYRTYRCPSFYVGTSSDVERLLQYTRPDVILTIQGSTLSRLLPTYCSIPALIMQFVPETNEANWVRWLHYLANERRNGVYKQDYT